MAHEAVAGSNHLSFLPLFYSGRRSTLFLFLESVSLVSTTQDRVLLDAIAFLLAHKGLHSKWLAASHAPLSEDDRGSLNPLDLSFVADKWWPLVTGNKDRGAVVGRIDRRYFELCVFSNVMLELKPATFVSLVATNSAITAKSWCRRMNSSVESRFTANRRAFPWRDHCLLPGFVGS